MRQSLYSSCAAVLSLLAGHAMAQTATTDSTEQIQVTAKRLEKDLPQDLAHYGVNLTTISNAAIKNGGYLDVTETLSAKVPGFYIEDFNGPFDYVEASYEGSRTSDILWLVDDVRINNRLYASTTPLDTIPAGIIDHIEILEGGESLFYGTQAIAGAVNIVTRTAGDHPEGSVSVGADTNRSQHTDAHYSTKIGQNQFLLYGSYDRSDGYQPFRQQDYQPSALQRDRAYQVWTAGGKYSYDFSSDLRVNATYQFDDAHLPNMSPYEDAFDQNRRQETLITGKLEDQITSDLAFYVKTYYHE